MLDNYPKQNIIFGPPGTGKTTFLVNIVKQCIEAKIPMKEVGYFAFTRAAALEAKARATSSFSQFNKSEFEYFSTIHSLCFKLLNLSREYVIEMRNSHGRKFCYEMGYSINSRLSALDEEQIITKDDRLCLAEQKARNLCLSMDDFYNTYDDREFTSDELVLFHESFKKYRKTKGLKDFTDMLEAMASEDFFIPSLDVLIIDEAQDFSELQWRVAQRLIDRANQVFVAGDDDQAIYTFAGASAKPLVEMGNSKDWNSIVLNKSYRIPKLIQKVAFNTLNKIPISERIVKEWEPKAEAGIVKNIIGLQELPLQSGQWCFLARTSKILKKYARELRYMGYRYKLHDEDSVKSAYINAIKLYEKFRTNSLIGLSKLDELDNYIADFKLIRENFKSDFAKLDQLPVKMYKAIADTPWYKIFNKGIPREDIEYYRDILRKQDSLEEGKDRIFLKTMHSAKGLEWENVVVIYDISPATEATLLRFPGDEFRVLYVAETRAKQGLYRMFPQSNRHYPFDI